ncbi:MAG: DUF3810 domain-containing protein [Clostridia bacterium]|nr:DUF3810 domain-containing protein [Clostridia bacterium]
MTDERGIPAEKRGILKYVPVPSLVFFIIGVTAAALHVSFVLFPRFSDFFNGTVSAAFRAVLAYVTSVYPASLAELVVISTPIILFLTLRALWRYMTDRPHGFSRALAIVLSVAALMYSLFVFDFAAGYRTTRIADRMGLTVEKTTAEDLYSVTQNVIGELNAEVPTVAFRNGASVMPYSHERCVELISEAYDRAKEDYPFLINLKGVPVKRLVTSKIVTYTHISGMFSFYTGEANLNTNYPDFVNVFSTAHEMAHQRGIAREDEANFVAFVVLIRSDDPYLRYCAYLNMYEYLADPLYSASKKLYSSAAAKLDKNARADLRAYSEFFTKYKNSTASKITERVNDGYLVLQGTEGTRSYGLVADLAVAYYMNGDGEGRIE